MFKRTFSYIALSAILIATTTSIAEDVHNDITSNTTWFNGTTYEILADGTCWTPDAITVRNGAILTIEKGAIIEFHTGGNLKSLLIGYSAESQGQVIAQGEPYDSITFCSDEGYTQTDPGSLVLLGPF